MLILLVKVGERWSTNFRALAGGTAAIFVTITRQLSRMRHTKELLPEVLNRSVHDCRRERMIRSAISSMPGIDRLRRKKLS